MSQGSSSGFVLINSNQTIRYTLTGVTAEGTLTASISAGALTDLNGNPSQAFSGNYSLDLPTVPFATLLSSQPLGTLVYSANVSRFITPVADTDSLTLAVDPGQTITVLVTPSAGFRPTVQVIDSLSNVVGTATATAAGQNALIQTIALVGGAYTITLSGAASTTGTATIQVILNSAQENEGTLSGATNDTRATAQAIDASALTLQTSLVTASRAAILGSNAIASPVPFSTSDFESGAQGYVINNNVRGTGTSAGLWHLSTRRGAQSGHSASNSFYYGAEVAGTYDTGAANAGTITSGSFVVPTGGSLSFNYVLLTESDSAFDVVRVLLSTNGFSTSTVLLSNLSGGGLVETGSWVSSASASLAAFAGQTVQVRFSFDTTDSVANNFEGWYVDDVTLSSPGTWSDYYSFAAVSGETVSVGLRNLVGTGVTVALENSVGTTLVTGAAGATNVDSAINNFSIPATGTYFVRVTGSLAATYGAVLTRNAAFDMEANDSAVAPQALAGIRGALGYVVGGGSPNDDWYSVTLSPTATSLQAETRTPADVSGEFVNTLDPLLRIYDSTGTTLLGTGTPLGDGRNESLLVTGLTSGALYRVRVAATGATSGEYFLGITPNSPPSALALSASTIAENAGVNASVGSFNTTDPDAANTYTYTFITGTGDTDNGLFNISGSTLRATSSLDFEASPTRTVRIRTTDQGGLTFDQAFSITVTNVNETPTVLALSASTIAENAGVNALVGSFNTTDPDAANTFTYTFITGTGDTDNGLFNISGGTLRATSSLDFEASPTRTVRIRTTDQGGLTFDQAFSITVTNVNETPTALALSASTITENAGVNASVGTVSTTDPDAANTFTYTFITGTGDTDNGLFNISGNTLRATNSLDFEGSPTRTVRFRTTDQGGLTFDQAFSITVTNVNETPTALALSASTITENAGVNASVGSFNTTDPDAANTFTYTFITGTGDTDNGLFNISGNSLRATSSLDFEASPTRTVRIRTTDQGGLTFDQAFSITILDVLDSFGITVNPVFGLTTTEAAGAGHTATFTVVLNAPPTSTVQIDLTSSNTGEGTVSPTSLTFAPGDWFVARTVTVTGVDELIDDGNVSYQIITAPAVSSDPNYSGRDAANVSLTNIDNDLALSTTSVTPSVNPSVFGSPITLTASVSGSSGTATGSVEFFNGAASLGIRSLNASGIAVLTSLNLNAGVSNITAVYGGDSAYAGSTSLILAQTVNKAPTSTSLNSSFNPSTPGLSVTFTATVTPTPGVPTGTVTFMEGAATLSVVAVVAGTATYTTNSLTIGSHTLTAVYSGNGNLNASSGLFTQTVNPGTGTLTDVTSLTSILSGVSTTNLGLKRISQFLTVRNAGNSSLTGGFVVELAINSPHTLPVAYLSVGNTRVPLSVDNANPLVPRLLVPSSVAAVLASGGSLKFELAWSYVGTPKLLKYNVKFFTGL